VKPAARGSWTGRPRAVPWPGACRPCSSGPMGDPPSQSTRLHPCAATGAMLSSESDSGRPKP
jgi:hypothetical protein